MFSIMILFAALICKKTLKNICIDIILSSLKMLYIHKVPCLKSTPTPVVLFTI